MMLTSLTRAVPSRLNQVLRLVATVVFVLAGLETANAAEPPIDRPMDFVLIHGGTPYCRDGGSCADWIAAEGQIMSDSPRKLQKLLKKIGKKSLPIVVRSPGGDVAAAMQMGLIIRRQGLSVAVGGTRADACDGSEPLCDAARQKDGSMTGEIYSNGAVCLSACPLLLAGGVRRIASPFALIGVHQITTTYREMRVQYRTEYEMLNGKKKILSQREVGRKMVGQHDTTKLGNKQKAALIAYLTKMGVDPDLFDLMMSANPQSIRLLTQVEALNLKMMTEQSSAGQLAAAGACPREKTISDCVVSMMPAPPPPPPSTPQSKPLPDEPEPGMPQPLERQALLPVVHSLSGRAA
ncbi:MULTISPECIES: hypothetical protein [Rhizobium]|uniref:Uncharacterized protein n=1 Tax=Rhizobium rhododendri TaxID=2506430 RepID=A0ABY8IET0_9HYPH|nr:MULTISPECIES: hypothetical protein [Rhizobium]MBZ5758728.1 hypothetical protein [Rhizobium sp. VS19-DR96]MBZ5764442.1 hypothetical protein [Rhizobium sp. VS19-DR129.2]MBZ5771985.1 hypothetical protein [Rhizobium sp. VS19-DRK62.2]MBZ5783328.1 hypothetical protein [Rhizobium sp. VS19-DR121]MBZ5800776.1 hypothetical protein [Rhizobium sp. VS19-DR181]